MALHLGQVSASNRPDGGLVVTIKLPALVAPLADSASFSDKLFVPKTATALDS
jgi:hypothetical protein